MLTIPAEKTDPQVEEVPGPDADAAPDPVPGSARRGRVRRILLWVLPLVVLAAAGLGAARLVATKPAAVPAAPAERVWLVSVEPAQLGPAQPMLALFGDVVSGRTAEIRAPVAGDVVEAGAALVDGGRVRAGDLLVAVDAFEYSAAREEAEAEISEIRARINEYEERVVLESEALDRDREILALLQKEVERKESLAERGNVSTQSLEESKRTFITQNQQMSNRVNSLAIERAKLSQQRAAMKRAEVQLRRAERDLFDTVIIAPFAGFVSHPAAQVGQRLGVNDRIVTLIDAERLEARIQVPASDFGRLAKTDELIGREARVVWRVGESEFSFRAVVDRVSSEIDPTSGSVEVFARIADAEAGSILRPGAFVEVLLPDRRLDGVADLPAAALHGGDTVYVVDDGRLAARRVSVEARSADRLLVRGELADGDRVVTTRFQEIAPGLAVEVYEPAAARSAEADG